MINGNAIDPLKKGENRPKFLKEMQTLIPMLQAKGIIPPNREQARAAGEKNTRTAALKKELEHQRRLGIIGARLDEYMLGLTPFAFKVARIAGWGWLLKALGYSYSIWASNEIVKEGTGPVDCTIIQIHRQWFPLFRDKIVKAERLIWEEPQPVKSRIIKP